MIWDAVQYVGTGLSLVAFIVSVILFSYRAKLNQRARIIESAPERERVAAIAATAEFFNVDISGLSKSQQKEIVLAQIAARGRRDLLLALFTLTVAVLLAIVALVAILSPTKPDLPKVVGCFDKPFIPTGGSKPKLPAHTGWLWAGYVNIQSQKWVEGPFLTFGGDKSPDPTAQPFQIGDSVITRSDRSAVMVNFKNEGDCNWEASPVTISGAKLRPEDYTGVVVPKDSRLKVRDVSVAHTIGNPIHVVWLRIAYDEDPVVPVKTQPQKEIFVCFGKGGGPNCQARAQANLNCDQYGAYSKQPGMNANLANAFCTTVIDGKPAPPSSYATTPYHNTGGGELDCSNKQIITGINCGEKPIRGISFAIVGGSSISPERLRSKYQTHEGYGGDPEFILDEDRFKIMECRFASPVVPGSSFSVEYSDNWEGSMRADADGFFFPEPVYFQDGLAKNRASLYFDREVAAISSIEINLATGVVKSTVEQPKKIVSNSPGFASKFLWEKINPTVNCVYLVFYRIKNDDDQKLNDALLAITSEDRGLIH